MCFALDDITISHTNSDISVVNNTTVISIDGSDIFSLQGILLNRIHDSAEIREERRDNENFQLPWNKTWRFSVQLFKVCFPHKHCYAEAVQNEFISIWKWLKITHSRRKMPFTVDSPLPSDLIINVSL